MTLSAQSLTLMTKASALTRFVRIHFINMQNHLLHQNVDSMKTQNYLLAVHPTLLSAQKTKRMMI